MSQDLEAGLFIGFILGAVVIDCYVMLLLRGIVRRRQAWYDQYYAEKAREYQESRK